MASQLNHSILLPLYVKMHDDDMGDTLNCPIVCIAIFHSCWLQTATPTRQSDVMSRCSMSAVFLVRAPSVQI